MPRLSAIQPIRLVPLIMFGIVVAACGGGGGDGGTPPGTTAIAKTGGDAQSGTVGQPLPTALSVRVTEEGAPSAGATVAWSTAAAGGSVNPTSAVTDANGNASTIWTLGTVAGAQSATAALSGASGSPLNFAATAAADVATTLVQAGGDGQSGQINAQLALPVQARVRDQFGNGVAGTSVAWSATGAAVSAPTVASDASGISAVNVTLGGTDGPITITAVSDGLSGSPLTFSATATSPTTSVNVVNNEFSPSAIAVSAGTTITWTWSAGAVQHNVAPDGTVPARSGNPVNAPASYQFTFNTPGTYRYHCEAHGAPGGVGMSGIVTVQ